MKISVFTAADDGFFPLLEGMITSLSNQVGLLDINLFDDGISQENLEKLPNHVRVIKRSSCEVFLDTYDVQEVCTPAAFSSLIRTRLDGFGEALGADVVVWIDADIWFQTPKGFHDLVWATNFGDLAAIPEIDRLASYVYSQAGDSVARDLLHYFGQDAAARFSRSPIMNNGFFAAKISSPVWKLWQEELTKALQVTHGKFYFGIEQSALTYAVLQHDLPFSPLPYTHNYNARLFTSLIEGNLCVNSVPFEMIHVVHLIRESKNEEKTVIHRNNKGEVLGVLNTKVDYYSIQKLKEFVHI